MSDKCAWDSCEEGEKCIELTLNGFFCIKSKSKLKVRYK